MQDWRTVFKLSSVPVQMKKQSSMCILPKEGLCRVCVHKIILKCSHVGIGIALGIVGAHTCYLKVVLSVKLEIVFGQDKFNELDQRIIARFDLRMWSEFIKGFFGCTNPGNVRNDCVK